MPVSKLYNIGFYKLPPKSVSCMSYEAENKKLAVCRNDATIEIWNVKYAPFIEKTIASNVGENIEAVVWCNNRLFAAKIQGLVTEYDLQLLQSKHNIPVTSGAAWCLDVDPNKNYLAVGTEAGYINIYSIAEESFDLEKLLDRQEGRILCLKYNASGDSIVTGSVDTVRVWNVKTGNAIHKMMTGRASNNQETIVWSLAVTSDFTIISGDSRGRITFWNGNLGTFMESYLSHRADILTVCLSNDEQTIYCAGIDPIIMSFVKVQLKENNYKWVKSIQRKVHDHDVRSLVLAENKLYSAGIDGYLAMSTYPPKTLIKYPPIPQGPLVSVSTANKVVLFRFTKHLELWKLAEIDETLNDETTSGILPIKERPVKLLELKSKDNETILCSAISMDGTSLAYSTNTRLRIFNLTFQNGGVDISRIDDLAEDCHPGFKMEFSKAQLIIASFGGDLQVVNLSHTLSRAVLGQTISTKDCKGTVNILKVSPCGKYLVVADTTGRVVVWSEEKTKKEDPHWKVYTILPKYSCPATALSIQLDPALLVVAYSDAQVIEYNIKGREFTPFSSMLSTKITRKWTGRTVPILGVAHDPRVKNIIILYDDSSLYIIDKSKELPEVSAKIPRIESPVGGITNHVSKREHAICIVKKYKHMVHFNHMQDDELIAVEINPMNFINQLPPALKTKQFGVM